MPRERTCLAEDYVAITLLSCLDKAGANEGREDPALPGVRRAKPFHAAPYDFKEWQKFLVQQQRGKQAAMGRCPNEHLRTNRPGEQIIPATAAAAEVNPPGFPGHARSQPWDGAALAWGCTVRQNWEHVLHSLLFFFLRCKRKVCISNPSIPSTTGCLQGAMHSREAGGTAPRCIYYGQNYEHGAHAAALVNSRTLTLLRRTPRSAGQGRKHFYCEAIESATLCNH